MAANGLPLEEKSLSEILGTGEDGSPKMYTTLYDDQNRVISTNDPTLEQDPFYLGGGTLDLGAAVYVRFRMAEILSQHEGGVQKNVTYYMEKSPAGAGARRDGQRGQRDSEPGRAGRVLPAGRQCNRARRHLRQPGRVLLLCGGALTVLAVRKKKSNR